MCEGEGKVRVRVVSNDSFLLTFSNRRLTLSLLPITLSISGMFNTTLTL